MKYLVVFGDNYINNKLLSNIQSKNDLLFLAEKESIIFTISRVLTRKHDSVLGKIYKLLFFIHYILFLQKKVYKNVDIKYEKNVINNVVKVSNINSKSCFDIVEKLDFDAILVFGASILGRKWLNFSKPIINIHLGIAPKYKGRFCWFWPVVYEDYENIGVTCHFITDKVDQGEIILQKRLSKQVIKGSNFPDIFIKVFELSVNSINELLNLKQPVLRKKQKALELSGEIFYEPGIDDYIGFIKNLDNKQ